VNQEQIRDWRPILGTVSVWLAAACFVVGLVIVVVIFGFLPDPAANSFSDRVASVLVHALVVIAITSFVTLILSCFANDRKRAFALAISIVNVLFFASVLGAGE